MSEDQDQGTLDAMREQLRRSREKLSGDAAKPVEELREGSAQGPDGGPDEVAPPPAMR